MDNSVTNRLVSSLRSGEAGRKVIFPAFGAGRIGLLMTLLLLINIRAFAQNDLPVPTANIKTINSGALVVAMDNTTQAVPGYFNLKAYGLINQLLQNDIPVKWAIRAGKAKDGIDFTSTAQREYPSVIAANTYNFKAGPFIVDSAYGTAARAIIAAYGKNVAVYRLTQDVNVDIRYTLLFKPHIGIYDHGGTGDIHLAYLLEAGFDTLQFSETVPGTMPLDPCMSKTGAFSFVSEPHWSGSDTAITRPIYRFVKAGGNFLAQCHAIEQYENSDTLHTTTGVKVNGPMNIAFDNSDMPYAQFEGPIIEAGGSGKSYYPKAGGAFRSNHYRVVYNGGSGDAYVQAGASKSIENTKPGGNVFYLGEHDYGDDNDLDEINGRRMYLNCIFIPPGYAGYCIDTALAISVTPQPVSCNGNNDGAVTSTAIGGVPPYEYLWSTGATTTGITNLAPGTYTVTVTDITATTATASATVTEPAVLVAAIDSVWGVTCNGNQNGRVFLDVTGGTPNYTYLWSPGGQTTQNPTGLDANTYTVTVTDARFCRAYASITLTEPAAIGTPVSGLAVAHTDLTCHNDFSGTASFDTAALGGTPPFIYLWSNGATTFSVSGLSAGMLNVIIIDANGCSQDTTFNILEPDTLLTGFTGFSAYFGNYNVTCNGASDGAADFNVIGGTVPYAYLWSNGGTDEDLTNVPAGQYYVTITDQNGCTAIDSSLLTEPDTLASNRTSPLYAGGYNIACKGEHSGSIATSTTGGTPSFVYSWTGPGGFTSSDENLTALYAGLYSLTLTDANGCISTDTITLTEPAVIVPLINTANLNGVSVSCWGSTDGIAWVDSIQGGTPPFTLVWDNVVNADTLAGAGSGGHTLQIIDANGCILDSGITLNEPPPIVSQISTSAYGPYEISCHGMNDGTISIDTVFGGVSPYTFSWSTGETTTAVSGLTTGVYSVVITDANGCIDSIPLALTEPDSIIFAAYSTHVECNGDSSGSLDVTSYGGNGYLAYSWSNGLTDSYIEDLASGSYSYTVTDENGCFIQSTEAITEPPLMTVATDLTHVLCFAGNTGSARLMANGGVTPYAYIWTASMSTDTAATGLIAATYQYTVADANYCTVQSSLIITQPTALGSGTGSTDVLCNGGNTGTAAVNVNGGVPGYSYFWSSSAGTDSTAANLIAGSYSVTVTDVNGCTTLNSVTVNEPAIVTSSISSQTNVSCNAGSDGSATALAGGGLGGYSYIWSSGDTNATATALAVNTYSCTVTDGNGCTSVTSVIISEPTVLVSSFSQANVLCNGGAGTATIMASGGTSGYAYSWSSSAGTDSTETGLAAGTYFYTVTDANGCITTSGVTITEPTVLAASYSQTNVSCNGGNNGTATVMASGGTTGYSYRWSSSAGTDTTEAGLTANTYIYTVTDANGCFVTNSFSITEPLTLVTSSVEDSPILCNGGGTTVTVSSTDGTPGYTGTGTFAVTVGSYIYTVTDANGCTAATSITISEPTILTATAVENAPVLCNAGSTTVTVSGAGGTISYTGTGTFTVTAGPYSYTITDAYGCLASASITISEPTLLTNSITLDTAVACNGGNASISVAALGGTPVYTGTGSFSVTAGPYTYIVTDANGCTATASIVISEPTVLTTSYTQTDAICNGSLGTATVTPSGGTAGYFYSWSPSGGTNSNATGLSPGNYSCLVTDANNCVNTVSITITEASSIVIAPAYTNIACSGNTTGTALASVSGGTPGYAYLWSNNSTQTAISNLPSSLYVVTVTDASGCTSISSMTITEPTVLIAPITVDSAILCNGGSAVITVLGSGGVMPYNGTGTFNVTANTYNYTVTDANGCTAAAPTLTITEPATLIASVTQNAPILCNGGSTLVTVAASGGTAAYNGTGAFGVGAGIYNYTVTDVNGCASSAGITVNQPALLTHVITSNISACNGVSNGSATVSISGGTPSYVYSWLPVGGTNASATGLAAGAYICFVTDANACNDVINLNIAQNAALTTNAGADQTICGTDANLNSQLLASQSGVWSGSGSFASNTSDVTTVSGLSYGTNTIIWNITDNTTGCQTSDTLEIEAYEPVTADIASLDTAVCPSEFTGAWDIQAMSPVPGTGIWSLLSGIGNFTDSLAAITQFNAPKAPGVNYLLWSVNNGPCAAADTMMLRIKEYQYCIGLDLPTGFTPNGDGHNDDFFIPGIEAYPDNIFLVFNRWGNEVFRAEKYANNERYWYGQNMFGKPLPDGTYYVILSINKGEITFHSYVDLRR